MLPTSYESFWLQHRQQRMTDYASGTTDWVVGLAPEVAVNLPATEVSRLLIQRLGEEVFSSCLDPENRIPSPVASETNGNWLKTCHTVGVNVRIIGSFWEVVKYATTLPDHIRGIHLLPIWEPGVVGSLYGMASWQLNPEFYSQEAAALYPQLARIEDQLAAVINLLHAMGKVVGMDVIPHTDRYSELVLANPSHFEWIRRWDLSIISHRDYLHEEAQGAIIEWLRERGPALSAYGMVGEFWRLSEENRLKLLFGHPDDYGGRQGRRVDLVDWLYHRGLEPAPATMGPPYRGLEVDPNPEAMTIDDAGRVWRDYRITESTEMSRAFGPLTRYKLYGRKDDNENWEIDFEQPRTFVWDYLTQHYAKQQARYNFDFMRGDMSHVQMRPDGVPKEVDDYYDPLRAVKRKIAESTPHFAYFAESFLTEPGYMAFGDEVEHLERSEAEVTLGNLQSSVPGYIEFWVMIDHYLDVANRSTVTPAWTVITGDKDDPRFDHFHHHGELARLFTGLFLGKLPMYFSLGFEQRDRHLERAANEVYSKLYVFQETRGDKAVSGPFQWGSNLALFASLTELNRFAAGIMAHLGETQVLGAPIAIGAGVKAPMRRNAPVPKGESSDSKVLAWLRSASDGEGAYLFVVNFSPKALPKVTVAPGKTFTSADLLFSTKSVQQETLLLNKGTIQLTNLAGGRCYLLK